MDVSPGWRAEAKAPAPTPGSLIRPIGFSFEVSSFEAGRVLELAQFWQPVIPSTRSLNREEALEVERLTRTRWYKVLWIIKEQAKVLNPKLRKVLGEEQYAVFEAHKQYADPLNSLYNLSYAIFDYLEIGDGETLAEYESWGALWFCVFAEESKGMVDAVLSGSPYGGRREAINYFRTLRESLTRWEIPENLPPHIHSLLSHGAMIAKHNPRDRSNVKHNRRRFREAYWKPYLDSLRRCESWLEALDHPDRALPENIAMVWPNRDKSGHIYAKNRSGKNIFLHKRVLQSI